MLKPSLKRGTIIISVITIFLGLFLIKVEEAKAWFLEGTVKDLLQGIFAVLLSLAQLFTGLVTRI